ncbi:hypothetical protein [Williamsia phyllosphaerae]|uniref:Uncharacterized protein n=1 Tax=Williamsia phyllosphaerae TaxID=885042 RepID=A0ABQ1V3X8_9NOCA|nr:hypothetical protein [Williamsia phyllosphaerae]GGF34683.1 hypothetical protein GCM10007298_33090 [Williamsia phyllosphaerae]
MRANWYYWAMALSTALLRSAPGTDVSDTDAAGPAEWSRRRRIGVAVAVLIVAQLALRTWVAARGDFYWDDLVLIGRAGSDPIGSWAFLGHNHDGHFMPAAFAVAGIATVLAPLSWPVAAATLLVGQLIASLAVARMLLVVAGARVATVAALAFYLFTPLTVPSFAWWASGLNTLPLQAAMAWVVADAVLLCRGPLDDAHPVTRPRTIVIRSAIICAVALAFFEKSALILPIAFAAAILCVRLTQLARRPDEPTCALPVVLRRGRALWCALLGVTAVWAVVFGVVARPGAGEHSLGQAARLTWRAIDSGVVPGIVGGPWNWDRWIPSPPFAVAAAGWMILGWIVAVGLIGAALWARRGAGAVVVVAVGYVVLAQALVSWNRSSADTALELSQTLRYLPDAAVVLALAAALVISAPVRDRERTRALFDRRPVRVGVATAMVAVTVSAVVSTVAFTDRWHEGPTASYLANARSALAANADTPMFDQAVPLEVLLPVAYPNNLISRVFARLPDRPQFGDWTDRLQVLSPTGTMTPGAVTRTRSFAGGSGACDRPEITARTALPLDGPLIGWRWTVQIPYCATSDGTVEISVGTGAPVTAPVRAGLHPLWVQASGTGTDIVVRPLTAGLALHVAAGQVGQVFDPALF